MRHKLISLTGKRVLAERNRRGPLALLLVLSLLTGLFSMQGPGGTGAQAAMVGHDQVVSGGPISYDEFGVATSAQSYAVNLNKRVSQALDGNYAPQENRFLVDMIVETAQNYENVTFGAGADVVLVLDISKSMMSCCADCGRPISGHDDPNNPHSPVSRMTALRESAKVFVESYGTVKNAGQRNLSIVVFGSSGRVYADWCDVSDRAQRQTVLAKIDGLTDALSENESSTNFPSGTILARNLLIGRQLPSTVIFFSDGAPNVVLNTTYEAQNTLDMIPMGDMAAGEKNGKDMIARVVGQLKAGDANRRPAEVFTVCFDRNPSYAPDQETTNALWLRTTVATDNAHALRPMDQKALADAFQVISQNITIALPDNVTDPIPAWFKFDGFKGENNGAKLTANNSIFWDFTNLKPMDGQGESGKCRYRLRYYIVLDNTNSDYIAQYGKTLTCPLNETAATFTYSVFKSGVSIQPRYTVAFSVSTITSYTASYSFVKVNPQGAAIKKIGEERGQFQLTADTGWTSPIAYTGSEDGKVTFTGVPSGHAYTLHEVKPPQTFTPAVDRQVAVSWGAVTAGVPNDKLVNQYDEAKKSFTVQKLWVDDTGLYQNQTVSFTIRRSDTGAVVGGGSLNKSNADPQNPKLWRVTLTDQFPTKDAATGADLAYTIEEKAIDHTTAHYDHSALSITNTVSNTQTITVKKQWLPEPPDGQATVSAHLYRQSAGDDTYREYTSVTLTGPNWTWQEDVPVLDPNGNAYQYFVGEDAVPGYTLTNIDMSTKNTYTLINTGDTEETIDKTFHVHWVGDDAHTRQGAVTVDLYADGVKVEGTEVTKDTALTENPDVWVFTFDGLPRYSGTGADKAEINYTVQEASVPDGYTAAYSGIDIINTWNKTSLTVHKNWVAPEGVEIPQVTFHLLRDGVKAAEYLLPPGELSYTFANLDIKSDGGQKYTYTVQEDPVAGFTSNQEANSTTFTNTAVDPMDVTVSGAIKWELRGEPESVPPSQVILQLYADNEPVAGKAVTATAEGGWTYSFADLPRYTDDCASVIDYSVRELGQNETTGAYDKPAPDKSTVVFGGVDFGAHYTVEREAVNRFVCNIRNHTDAEEVGYSSRVDRVYDHYMNGTISATATVAGSEADGTRQLAAQPFDLIVNTGDYTLYNGNTYTFVSGDVAPGPGAVQAGANTVSVTQPDQEQVVTLRYELRETTTGPVDPGRPDPPSPATPTPPVSPSVSPSPSASPTPTPVVSPGPSAGPTPTPAPSAVPTPAPSIPPAIQPPPRPLTPEEQERVDEKVTEAIQHPDIIIRDRDTLQEQYPELDIDDLPTPLYWGPDFAVIELSDGELIVIDSDLIPLGNLPQTGTFGVSPGVWRAASLLLAAAVAAGIAAEFLRRREEDKQ